METISADGQAAHSEWPYSGFWRRVAATVIDNLILIIPFAIVSALTFGVGAIILLIGMALILKVRCGRQRWESRHAGLPWKTCPASD